MKRIFISYSRQDRDFANRLAQSLADLGADVWIDYEDIPAGQKWSSAIQEGLDTSDGLLVLISPESMISSNVEDEWQYFIDSKRPVIPILYKPAKIHFQLHRLQYVDFSSQRFGDAFAKLLDELSLKGISLQVEEAEDTAIYDVRRSKPPKNAPEAAPESMLATAPSMKISTPTEPSINLKKPVLTKPNQRDRGDSLRPLILPLLLILGLVAGLAALIYFLGGPPIVEAKLSDFDGQPLPLTFEGEDFEFHAEVDSENYLYFDEVELWYRFVEDGQEWFSAEDVESGEVGYQIADNLPLERGLLMIVPVTEAVSNLNIRLYTAPSNRASSYAFDGREEVLVHGYRYDDSETLWYYVMLESGEVGYMGWAEADTDRFGLVGDVPAIAFTTDATETYWSKELGESVYTIPSGVLLRVVAQHENRYMIAHTRGEGWFLLWVDGSTVDINEASSQFLEQK